VVGGTVDHSLGWEGGTVARCACSRRLKRILRTPDEIDLITIISTSVPCGIELSGMLLLELVMIQLLSAPDGFWFPPLPNGQGSF